MRILMLIFLLLGAAMPALDAPADGRRAKLQAKIEELRSTLLSEAEALEELQESGWWNLVNRRRRETRLRRLRGIKIRIDRLEKELAELKNPGL